MKICMFVTYGLSGFINFPTNQNKFRRRISQWQQPALSHYYMLGMKEREIDVRYLTLENILVPVVEWENEVFSPHYMYLHGELEMYAVSRFIIRNL